MVRPFDRVCYGTKMQRVSMIVEAIHLIKAKIMQIAKDLE